MPASAKFLALYGVYAGYALAGWLHAVGRHSENAASAPPTGRAFHNLDGEDENRIRWDLGGRGGRSVGEARFAIELPFVSLFHELHRFGPRFDHLRWSKRSA